MEELVDLSKNREWKGPPGKVKVPEVYEKFQRYEIVVFVRKERGGNDFVFHCWDYKRTRDGQWRFDRVMLDSSIKNAEEQVVLGKVSYHPKVLLVNVAFMVYPKPEDAET